MNEPDNLGHDWRQGHTPKYGQDALRQEPRSPGEPTGGRKSLYQTSNPPGGPDDFSYDPQEQRIEESDDSIRVVMKQDPREEFKADPRYELKIDTRGEVNVEYRGPMSPGGPDEEIPPTPEKGSGVKILGMQDDQDEIQEIEQVNDEPQTNVAQADNEHPQNFVVHNDDLNVKIQDEDDEDEYVDQLEKDRKEQRWKDKRKAQKRSFSKKLIIILVLCIAAIFGLWFVINQILKGSEDKQIIEPDPNDEGLSAIPIPENATPDVLFSRIGEIEITQRNSHYPLKQDFASFSQDQLDNHVLKQINYVQLTSDQALTGLQMIFESGKESPMFQTNSGFATQNSIELRDGREIRYVSMKMRFGYLYDGIRFFDKYQHLIKSVTWADGHSASHWTTMQQIPPDEQIVGFKCNVEEDSLHYLTLLLAKKGSAQITNEINIPELQIYPKFEEFEQLYNSGSFMLSNIEFKNRNQGSLSGLKFKFTNEKSSPMIQTNGANEIKKKSVQINTEKPIRYIQVKTKDGIWIDGIRFYDDDYEYLANQTWSSNLHREWRGLYVVPEGQTIIGFKCNVHDDVYSYINNLTFITGPAI